MRISLYCDNNLILGVSVPKRPEDDQEMIALLEELIRVLKAPAVPYTELLDKMETPHPEAARLAKEIFGHPDNF